MNQEPQTLVDAIRYFADPDVTLKTMVELRWPAGVTCPKCGSADVRFLATRRIWECKNKHAKRQFSAKVGTIFEDSALPLDKWFIAIWALANCKNGISSYELHRATGITQKSAWFVLHRVRLAMKVGSIEAPDGGEHFEADESFIGGDAKNMHAKKRAGKIRGRGGIGKEVVAGLIRRKTKRTPSKVKAKHIKDANSRTLGAFVRENVPRGANLHTDAFAAYRGLSAEYTHMAVDHASQYVRGIVHTNGCENFFSLLKRTIKGTYVSVEPFHLGAYLDEQSFRFNEREGVDADRFRTVLSSVMGKRLTYAELTGHDQKEADT